MRRVTVNGITYALPFERLLRPLSPSERDWLATSIGRDGVLSPVQTARTPAHGRILLDGMHRALIAEPLDADVPVVHRGDLTDAEARTLALALNVCRRHLTAEEQQAARQGRIARVATLASEGKTVRQIAEIEGVSKSQIGEDLQLVHPRTKRRKRPPAQRALSNVTSLTGSVRAVLRDRSKRPTLEAIAAQHGIPLSGTSWPALDAIRAVLRDVVGGSVSA